MTAPRWAFRYRGALTLPPLVFSLFWIRGMSPATVWPWALGLALVLAGVAVRVWAQQHLHHRLKVPLELTATGPYQMMRNPLYVGNLLIYVGVTALSRLVWMIPVTLVWCAGVYALVVRYEESQLRANYGEAYARYQAEVPRWLPRRLPPAGLGLRNEFLPAAIRSELHCFLIVVPFLLKEPVVRVLLGR